jgi:hypothetical protein
MVFHRHRRNSIPGSNPGSGYTGLVGALTASRSSENLTATKASPMITPSLLRVHSLHRKQRLGGTRRSAKPFETCRGSSGGLLS